MADIAKGGQGLIAALSVLAISGAAVLHLIYIRQVRAEVEIGVIGLLSRRRKACVNKPAGS
jgi:hypothetical protein